MTDKPKDARHTLHVKLEPEALRELRALAARDSLTLTAWLNATIRQQFRRLPKAEQARLLAGIEEDQSPAST